MVVSAPPCLCFSLSFGCSHSFHVSFSSTTTVSFFAFHLTHRHHQATVHQSAEWHDPGLHCEDDEDDESVSAPTPSLLLSLIWMFSLISMSPSLCFLSHSPASSGFCPKISSLARSPASIVKMTKMTTL